MDRKFFSNLFFDLELHTSEHQSVRIFTDFELENEPLKWLKYLLLVKLNFLSLDRLESQIYRFKFEDLNVAIDVCKNLMIKSEKSNQKVMVVFKAVPMNSTGMIENFRLYSKEDVDTTISVINNKYGGKNRQLWYCKSTIDSSTLSLGGRLCISRNSINELIEVVWYTSPRRIEDYAGADFQYPLWRATRRINQMDFVTELMHIPVQSKAVGDGAREFELDIKYLCDKLSNYNHQINYLTNLIFRAGATEISIEFKMDAGSLIFIDWDTDLETLIN